MDASQRQGGWPREEPATHEPGREQEGAGWTGEQLPRCSDRRRLAGSSERSARVSSTGETRRERERERGEGIRGKGIFGERRV